MFILNKYILRPVTDTEELYKNSRVEKEFPEMLKILSLYGKNTTNLWRLNIVSGTMATIFSRFATLGFTSNIHIQ